MPQTNPSDPSTKFLAKLTSAIKAPFIVGFDIIETFRLLLFLVYIITGVLRFWIWVLEKILGLFRLLIRILTVPLGVVSGVHYSSAYIDNKNVAAVKKIWVDIYSNILAEIAIILRSMVITAWVSWAIFWRVSVSRKIILLISSFTLVVLPLGFIVPRPEFVQIVDKNSIADEVGKEGKESYVILGTGFESPNDYRQYVNKDAWWLLKFNSQKVKTILEPGKSYQIWVTGYRITVPVEWYPNIIYAIECDEPKCGL